MASPLERYQSLSSASPTDTKITTLDSLTADLGRPFASIDATERTGLINELLRDLSTPTNGKINGEAVTVSALVLLKTLGRDPRGSSTIGHKDNLKTLLTFVKSSKESISAEAFRCVANALLLVDSTRQTWLDIGGGDACLAILKRESSPDFIFLASRVLFIVTSLRSDFILSAVNQHDAVKVVATKLDVILPAYQSGHPMSKDALTDLLKVAFNLLLQYPRMSHANSPTGSNGQQPVMGELWEDKLSPLVPKLLFLFNILPQTTSTVLAPPLTHVIHALLTVPVIPYANLWFTVDDGTALGPKPDVVSKARRLLSQRSSSPTSSKPGTPPLIIDTLRRAYDLLDATLAHFAPDDPDDPAVRALCRNENVSLDDTASPLALLIHRMCRDDQGARARMKQWLLPPDLDRTTPLEKRPNFLGRCIRMMSAVYFPKLKDSIGEMMFALCNSDANVMAAQIGYGNCAGFLFNKGIMAPPPKTSEEDLPDDPDINPVTGVKEQPGGDPLAGMTEEEKEREAEKLFVLFDRMERLGLAVNPVRAAMQEGRLEEVKDDDSDA